MNETARAFCDDSELGYRRSRGALTAGEPLLMDDAYRLAHLPLVAPDHPGAVMRRDGAHYDRGRHPRVFSLVIPVDPDALDASPAFKAMDAECRAASFSKKIAWDLIPRRRSRLHATLCGSLAVGEPAAGLADGLRRRIGQIDSFAIELRGLFSGNINIGRLYLRVYPERRGGANALQVVQQTLGQKATDLYLVGLYNFIDDLAPEETAELKSLIDRWWERPLLRLDVRTLWLLGSCDDLVLDASVAESFHMR
ncbi:MAG: hypothetical protein BGP06_02935 [Rhizobiales bacterium 65-9]|nr:MAG: hypothetical protein BGP06_02935 [Rhizobiales bacterium 65-9]